MTKPPPPPVTQSENRQGTSSERLEERLWPSLLDGMESVIAVVFDNDGQIIRGNLGFWSSFDKGTPSAESLSLTDYLVKPGLRELAKTHPDTGNEQVYEGLIHMGDAGQADVNTFRGSVTRYGEFLVLIAEHDVRSLQHLAAQVLHLNNELTEMHRELKRQQEQLKSLAVTDPLTGLANRRRLEERLELEVARMERTEQSLALALVDIDHFKRINDKHGHLAGDAVLKDVAAILTENLRAADLATRFGGEEFCLVLPDTSVDEALHILERVRLLIANRAMPPLDEPVTASFGVVGSNWDHAPEILIEAADKALYRAKNSGRNCVCSEVLEAPKYQNQ